MSACSDRLPTAPRSPGQSFLLSDAVHGGGTPGFYFLPPMVRLPAYSGTFDGDLTTLDPWIAICDITSLPDPDCGGATPAIGSYARTTTPAITVTDGQYQVNWDTRAAGFDAGHTYRLHVSAAVHGSRHELGFADVLLTNSPGQVKNLATDDLIVLQDGRTLPIKFRIEQGVLPCVPHPSGLVHWWPGENGPEDIIGGDNGTVVGTVSYAPGVVGQAFQFGNGYLHLTQNYGGSSTTEVTVMAWVLTQQTGPSAWQAVLSSTTSSFLHFQSSTFGGAAIYTDPGSAQFNEIPSFGPTPLNVWRHVALTAKPGQIRIYENGAVISELPNTYTYITQQNDAVLIGNGYGYSRPFPGLVDELQMYNRALTASEVSLVANAGADGVCRP